MIKEIINKLENSDTPIAKAIVSNECGKTIIIAFKKDMILKEHKTNTPAQLFVLQGEVIYTENQQNKTLAMYDSTEISAEVLHSVKAIKDSICILVK